MDLVDVEREMARLDALYEPALRAPIDLRDLRDPEAFKSIGPRIEAQLAELGVDDAAERVLRAVVDLYAGGDADTRTAIRQLFDRYKWFRDAAHLPREWSTPDEFRAHLILLSAADQGADTRDEILTLQRYCDDARRLGIDVDPILDEVAEMSSDIDRYGMGSMRYILIAYGKGSAG
jgi:hypothetical protein